MATIERTIERAVAHFHGRSHLEDVGARKARIGQLPPYRVDEADLGRQLHDRFALDAREVTDAVFESAASIVSDPAEHRLHTGKAAMVARLGS